MMIWTPCIDDEFAIQVLSEARGLIVENEGNNGERLQDWVCGFLTRNLRTYVIVDDVTDWGMIKGSYRSAISSSYYCEQDYEVRFMVDINEIKIIRN
jgi:hypothetical protein